MKLSIIIPVHNESLSILLVPARCLLLALEALVVATSDAAAHRPSLRKVEP